MPPATPEGVDALERERERLEARGAASRHELERCERAAAGIEEAESLPKPISSR